MSRYNQNQRQLSARGRRRQFTNPAITSNTYAGELALPFITPAVKSADTLAKGFVRQIDGIRKKAVLESAAVAADIIQAAHCSFQDGDSVTLDESVLELTDLKVNETLCRGTILPTWVGQVGPRASTDWASPEFRQFVLGTIAGKVGESVETILWQGSSLFANGFLSADGSLATGFATSALKDATVQAKGSSGSFTAATVISEFALAHTKAATAKPGILSKPGLSYYCSNATYALYMHALAGLGAHSTSLDGQGMGNLGPNQNFTGLTYLGITINVCPGMFDDCLVLADKENLVAGSNIQTDYTEVRYIPFYEYDGSDNVGVVMQWGMGCAVGTAADVIVLK